MSGYAGMSMSNSKNQSVNQGQFNQNIWQTQVPALQAMWNSALGQFNRANQRYNKQMNTAVGQNNQVMGMANSGLQNQLGGGAYAGIDANKLQDQIYSSMQSPTASQEINNMIMGGKGNNYADAMKAQYVQDANIASQNMLNNLDARASASGLPGSSRSAITQGVGLQGINQNLQRNLAETGFNTFDKDLDRKLAIAGQADQANLARQDMLSGMLAGKQNAMAGGLQSAPGIGQMGGFNTGQASGLMDLLGGLKGVIGDPTTLNSGSTYGSSLGRSSGWGFQGGGSGSGSGVICTELHRQGIMSDELYAIDDIFFDWFKLEYPDAVIGYHLWAKPLVKYMQSSSLFTAFIAMFAMPWAQEMAHIVDDTRKGSLLGKIIMKIGIPFCSFIGKARGYEHVSI